MSEIVWEEPPNANARRNYTSSDVDALMANPGRWARLGSYRTRGSAYPMAHRIKNGLLKKWQPVGAFEAVVRPKDGEFAVYARYVGEDGAQ